MSTARIESAPRRARADRTAVRRRARGLTSFGRSAKRPRSTRAAPCASFLFFLHMPSTRSRTRAGTSDTSRNTDDTGTLQSTVQSTRQSTPVSTQGIESLAEQNENEASAASGTTHPETDSEHHGAVDGEVNVATVNNGRFINSDTPDAGADADNGQPSPQVRTPADADVASPRSASHARAVLRAPRPSRATTALPCEHSPTRSYALSSE